MEGKWGCGDPGRGWVAGRDGGTVPGGSVEEPTPRTRAGKELGGAGMGTRFRLEQRSGWFLREEQKVRVRTRSL